MLPRAGAGFVDVAGTAQVPATGALFVAAGEAEIILTRDATGAIRAFSGRCPHAFARLAEGRVEGGQVICAAHGARFDLATGRALGNCPNLPAYPVKIEGRRVLVRPGQG
jgi:nitrite reductase/ring-hydroxylating ferredoxin subunit